MERLVRLFSASFLMHSFVPASMPKRAFGRLRHLRSLISCKVPQTMPVPDLFDGLPRLPPRLPSHQPAFARVSLNSGVHAQAQKRAPVRVYRGDSRVILVGNIEAVSRMIDRCIDEERNGAENGLFA
jgi:hypothetical protein